MEPTRIYVKPVLSVMEKWKLKEWPTLPEAVCWKTFPEFLPDNTQAVVKAGSWPRPEIFNWLQEKGNIEDREMYRVFNNGIGMAVIVAADKAEEAMKLFREAGETVYRIGEIEARPEGAPGCVVK